MRALIIMKEIRGRLFALRVYLLPMCDFALFADRDCFDFDEYVFRQA